MLLSKSAAIATLLAMATRLNQSKNIMQTTLGPE